MPLNYDAELLDHEINLISDSFHNLGSTDNFINAGQFKARRCYWCTKDKALKCSDKIVVLPLSIFNIAALFPRHDKKVCRSNTTVREFLRYPMTEQLNNNSGKIQFYVKTVRIDTVHRWERWIKRQFNQRVNYAPKMDPNSAPMKHIVDADRRVPVYDAVVIFGVRNVYQRRLFESAVINYITNFNEYQTALDLNYYTSHLLIGNIPSLDPG